MPNSSPTSRAWVRLPSGSRLDLVNPDAHAWTDSDLAIRLSRTLRWSGESKWSHPLSVAQHSLTVLALRRKTSSQLSPSAEMLELTHDAEEALLGFDCVAPLKVLLGKPFKDISDRLMHAIRTRYRLIDWTESEYSKHKFADLVAAASEAFYCVGWSLDEIRHDLGITHQILENDPLAEIYNCDPWVPWTAEVAADRFWNELKFIQNLTLPNPI